jgi:hypothetical protein
MTALKPGFRKNFSKRFLREKGRHSGRGWSPTFRSSGSGAADKAAISSSRNTCHASESGELTGLRIGAVQCSFQSDDGGESRTACVERLSTGGESTRPPGGVSSELDSSGMRQGYLRAMACGGKTVSPQVSQGIHTTNRIGGGRQRRSVKTDVLGNIVGDFLSGTKLWRHCWGLGWRHAHAIADGSSPPPLESCLPRRTSRRPRGSPANSGQRRVGSKCRRYPRTHPRRGADPARRASGQDKPLYPVSWKRSGAA